MLHIRTRHSPEVGIVSEGVRTDSFVFQGRGLMNRFGRIFFYQLMNPKAGEGLTVAVEEYRLVRSVVGDQFLKACRGGGPKGATALFVAFTMQFDCWDRQVQIGHGDLGSLRSPGSGVVEEEQ